ncbi:gliding motility lipoprotein GldH family protein [Flavobacterium selenitireducens]|uniref:hypothetical protein n=1 Tax=Flavobacterium selenitireducens TaxID=2722704 RepID=UPI00168A5907|nr:hypothetical protein [Flavobacterium selenitireducens]MBD3582098.1 gliding motility lipoprotein GldH [Flavobacterium selenitireducens]
MKRLALALLAILATSCTSEAVFSKTDTAFAANRWQKSDIKTYEFEIDQAATPYEMQVFFSHVYGYQFEKVPLIAEVTYPDGQLSSLKFDLIVKDASGELGDCVGDYCDMTQKIELARPLDKGKHKVRLMHDFNGEYLPNVLALGLRVEKLMD